MAPNTSHTPEQLLSLLQAAIRDAPALKYDESRTEDERRWLGRVDAILEASGKMLAVAAFRAARQRLGSILQSRDDLMMPLYDVLSAMELLVPASMQGAFIPPGDTWDGYSALVKLVQRECDDILIVDPYLSSDIYLYFAPPSAAKNGIRCLCQKMNQTLAGLQASAAKWASDPISEQHPVEVRFAAEKSLHDRLIIIDGKESWIITQSIKDIAKRSPASVTRAEPELAQMKSDYYETLWATATPLD